MLKSKAKGMIIKYAYNENIQNIKQAIKNNFGSDADKLISRIFYRNSKNLFKIQLDKKV